jgi:hypothetical protein
MTPETKFNRWVADRLLYDAHIQRIETSTGSGIPDMNICWHGREFWAESKVATPGGNVLLRPFQWAWLKRRQSHGGKSVILAQFDGEVAVWEPYNTLVVVHGAHLRVASTPSIRATKTAAGIASLRSFLMTI